MRADVGLSKENEENKAGRWKQIRAKQQEMRPAVARRSQCTALTLNHIIFSELTNSLLHPSACCHFNLSCTKNIFKKWNKHISSQKKIQITVSKDKTSFYIRDKCFRQFKQRDSYWKECRIDLLNWNISFTPFVITKVFFVFFSGNLSKCLTHLHK